MSQQTRTTLKTYFNTGDTPTETQFANLVDSQSNILDDALTFGIADTNKVQIDHAAVADNDYAKFTANGLEGRSYAEVLSDIGAEPAKGADDNYVTDAEKTVIGNTSGTNTGDQDLSALALKSNVLELDNTGAFTPNADYEPATKKYVDDSITAGGGYTDEQAQDAVGNAVGVGLDYDDTTGAISVDKTELSLAKGDVGLGNVDNTSDAGKPVSTAQQTALDLKEDLSNKSTDTALGTSNTLYPSQNAVKSYVDAIAQGLSVKQSVLLATAAALPTNTYLAGAITMVATGTLTVDGTVTALNDRILVKDESAQLQNGVYKVTTAGAIGVAAVLTRSTDMDVAAEFPGAFVFVESGTVNTAAGFVCTNSSNPTVGTTAITFTQFSGAGEITAGSALTKTANTLDVAVDGSSIEVNADALRVKAGGITSAMLAGTIDATKIADGSVTSTEFQYINTLSSNAQTQIDAKLASSSYTAADVLSKLLTVDGAGSGLDADLLDGNSSAAFATSTQGTTADNALPKAGGTMSGNITLGENTSIDLDPAGSADGKYTGMCITGTAGATLAFGDLIYLAVADSRWELADADATGTGSKMLGMCVLAAASDGDATKILLQGQVRADAKFPTLTVGAAAYVGETAGEVQVAIPTGADNVIRVVGFALTANELYFNPSVDHQISVA